MRKSAEHVRRAIFGFYFIKRRLYCSETAHRLYAPCIKTAFVFRNVWKIMRFNEAFVPCRKIRFFYIELSETFFFYF